MTANGGPSVGGAGPAWLDPSSRLLVIAPHPDDETLATGGLLQHALACGGEVCVVFLTDGDNNPWPQRCLERRWRIKAADRVRWGRRRRQEAQQALRALGVADNAWHAFGWPDMGLTAGLLEHGPAMCRQLATQLQKFAPTLVVMPALADRHPDHSAAQLLVRDALRKTGCAAHCLEYLVHGTTDRQTRRALPLDGDQQACKRRALLCHRSQVALARRRLLALVGEREIYLVPGSAAQEPGPGLPWRVPRGLRRAFDVLVHADGRTRRVAVPTSGCVEQMLREEAGQRAGWLYFKLRARWPSPWIFDHWGWRRVRAAPADSAAQVAQGADRDGASDKPA